MAQFLFPIIPNGAPQALTANATAANAIISVETYVTEITAEASGKAILPNGLKNGQLKKLACISVPVSGDTCAVTVTANQTSLTTEDLITLSASGNYVVCQWNEGNADIGPHWRVIEAGNIDTFNGTASDFIS